MGPLVKSLRLRAVGVSGGYIWKITKGENDKFSLKRPIMTLLKTAL
jgi:hypothetical protein